MIVELPEKDTQHVGILQNVCTQFENSENIYSVIEAKEGRIISYVSTYHILISGFLFWVSKKISDITEITN